MRTVKTANEKNARFWMGEDPSTNHRNPRQGTSKYMTLWVVQTVRQRPGRAQQAANLVAAQHIGDGALGGLLEPLQRGELVGPQDACNNGRNRRNRDKQI